MIELSNVAVPLDAGLDNEAGRRLLAKAAAEACGVNPHAVRSLRVVKRSVDARKKSNVHFVVSLAVELANAAQEAAVLEKGPCTRGVNVKAYAPYEPLAVADLRGTAAAAPEQPRPVVVGSGPAGLFAALCLAKAGLRPLVVERGACVEERVAAIEAFDNGGPLDVNTNIQFGEGGAGTFSDGKLNSGIKSPLVPHVLHWFADAGAPQDILVNAKPHIGTDELRGVVRTMRTQIEQLGGQVLFNTLVSGLRFEDGALCAVELTPAKAAKAGDAGEAAVEVVPANRAILATGHSARDTFAMLQQAGLLMEQKPFSVGVRIEHSQIAMNRAQYGAAADHPALGAADYKLALHLPTGRSVYTFCMCPGGQVVCAASEADSVVVNGMSNHARDGRNSNSALLVNVDPADFPGSDPLAGVRLQQQVERAAFDTARAAGGSAYQAPAQRVGDFLAGVSSADKASINVNVSKGAVQPTYARGVAWCDLHDCLPDFVASSLEEALPLADAKLHGFADAAAVMTGVETRSSSPVRVVRGKDYQAQWGSGSAAGAVDAPAAGADQRSCAAGLYPCGEGAGYAGGIMSAAVDGLRVALSIVDELAADAAGSEAGA